LARIAFFVIQTHTLHAAAWGFSADDKTAEIAHFRHITCRKIRHFLGDIFMRCFAEPHLDLTAGGLRQTQCRTGRRQADRHFRANRPEVNPLSQLIHDKAHTLMPAVEANGGAGQTSANTQYRFRCHDVHLQSLSIKVTQNDYFVQVLAELFFIV